MIDLRVTAHGIVLPVRATPGAKRSGVTGAHDGRLKVSVTQAPDKGKANIAILKLLADLLNLRRADIQLVAGNTSRQKEFLVTGSDPETLLARISARI